MSKEFELEIRAAAMEGEPSENGGLRPRWHVRDFEAGARAALQSALVKDLVLALKLLQEHYAPKDLGYMAAHNTFNQSQDALAAYRAALGEK
jgi:hypothetical protein